MEPKVLNSPKNQEMARRTRNDQWALLERIAEHDPLWVCWWDKLGRHSQIEERPDDLEVCDLITTTELNRWIGESGTHPDWIKVGSWSEERCATPVRITEAGRSALATRDQFDMEPVHGGLFQPGWVCIPSAGVVDDGESSGRLTVSHPASAFSSLPIPDRML